MKIWRVTHPYLGHDRQHYRTRREAAKAARDIKLYDMRNKMARTRTPPMIEQLTLPPVDANLIVDILNGVDPVITVQVVNRLRSP